MSGPSNGRLVCPECGGTKARIVDTRERPFGKFRRRECQSCSRRWNTVEKADFEWQSLDERKRELEAWSRDLERRENELTGRAAKLLLRERQFLQQTRGIRRGSGR